MSNQAGDDSEIFMLKQESDKQSENIEVKDNFSNILNGRQWNPGILNLGAGKW
jgi:hypothetical protein